MNLHLDLLSWDRYQVFLSESAIPRLTIYHHPLWLRSVERGLGMQVVILGIFDQDDLVGVLPGFVARKGPIRLFGSPLRGSMTPYLGWLCRDGRGVPAQRMLDLVYRVCTRRLRCHYIELVLPSHPPDFAADTAPPGWNLEQPATYVLDLRIGEAALWKNLGQRGRNMVTKARKSGVAIEAVVGRAIVDEFYAMLEASFARHRTMSPHPKAFYAALWENLMAANRLEVLVARKDGHNLAIGMFMHDDREIHFLSGGSLAEYHHLRPNNLLHWEVISRSAQRGLLLYDLSGKGIPSLDVFKESFGPTVQTYSLFWKAGPVLAFSRTLMARALPHLQNLQYRARRLFGSPKATAAATGSGNGPAPISSLYIASSALPLGSQTP